MLALKDFKYLKGKAGLIETDPTVELEAPRQSKKLPIYLELHEAKALLMQLITLKTNFLKEIIVFNFIPELGLRQLSYVKQT